MSGHCSSFVPFSFRFLPVSRCTGASPRRSPPSHSAHPRVALSKTTNTKHLRGSTSDSQRNTLAHSLAHITTQHEPPPTGVVHGFSPRLSAASGSGAPSTSLISLRTTTARTRTTSVGPFHATLRGAGAAQTQRQPSILLSALYQRGAAGPVPRRGACERAASARDARRPRKDLSLVLSDARSRAPGAGSRAPHSATARRPCAELRPAPSASRGPARTSDPRAGRVRGQLLDEAPRAAPPTYCSHAVLVGIALVSALSSAWSRSFSISSFRSCASLIGAGEGRECRRPLFFVPRRWCVALALAAPAAPLAAPAAGCGGRTREKRARRKAGRTFPDAVAAGRRASRGVRAARPADRGVG